MIEGRDASASDEEPWMALPLFKRTSSPDRTWSAPTWYGCWPSSDGEDDDEAEISQTPNAASEDVPMSSSSSLRPPTSLSTPDSHADDRADLFVSGSGHVWNSGLLCEISDKHIPQPAFVPRSPCPFQGCKSTAVFHTGRDFRRHYRHHFKRFFCRYDKCPQSVRDPSEVDKGFSTRKDRTRHEAKHDPAVRCQFRDEQGNQCSKVFSRKDNMRDHHKRIHGEG